MNLIGARNAPKLILALILIITVSGFAAANFVADSRSGDKNITNSSFIVSNVSYSLEPTDPYIVEGVSFNLIPEGLDEGTFVTMALLNKDSKPVICNPSVFKYGYVCNTSSFVIPAAEATLLSVYRQKVLPVTYLPVLSSNRSDGLTYLPFYSR